MPEPAIAFGDFRFTPRTGALWRGLEEVKLTPRTAAVLTALVERAPQVVTKDELLARVWKGKAVGDEALTSCIQDLRQALGDDARHPRFIETRHRLGYKLIMPADAAAEVAVADDSRSPPLPDKPSIAVLPFQNLSGDADQEYFADGVVEEITTALSRFRSLFVIARNSSFAYKARAVDVKQVGRELGVRYVLEGSVRKAAGRLRVVAQLVDALTGAHIWADRFDGALEDVFDLQDQVTEKVIAAIAPRVEQAEIARARRKPSSNLDAYDCYLRGLARRAPDRELIKRRLAMFRRAIELDPEFAAAYGAAVWCYVVLKSNGAAADVAGDMTEVARLARAAVSLGQDDAQTLSLAAHAYAYLMHDLQTARAVVDQALALNSNVAAAWVASGWIHVWLGNPTIAIEHLGRAMRLNPLDIPARGTMRGAIEHAYFYLGRFDEALSSVNQHLREVPDSHAALRVGAASAALAGLDVVARQMGARLKVVDPAFRVSNLKALLGPHRPEILDSYADALRKAGLPE
jgi:TolB-like protein